MTYISIVVPIYNVENYLERCINSLINQDINAENYEILLVNDGSTDNCGVICEKYSNEFENIKTYHKTNGGLSDARNYGIKNASGKYILFVDSDDYIQENALRNIIDETIKQNEPDIMFLQAKKVYSNGKFINYDEKMDIKYLCADKKEVLDYLGNRKMYPASAWSKMVKKSLLNNIQFKKGQLSEDYEWSLLLYLKAKTFGAYNGEYYYYAQNRNDSISSNVREKHFNDLITIVENMEMLSFDYIQEREFILKCAAYVYIILLLHSTNYYSKYRVFLNNKKYLLSVRKDKRVTLLKNVVNIFGIKIAVIFMNTYRKVKYYGKKS